MKPPSVSSTPDVAVVAVGRLGAEPRFSYALDLVAWHRERRHVLLALLARGDLDALGVDGRIPTTEVAA